MKDGKMQGYEDMGNKSCYMLLTNKYSLGD
jgi:hypothetical protein